MGLGPASDVSWMRSVGVGIYPDYVSSPDSIPPAEGRGGPAIGSYRPLGDLEPFLRVHISPKNARQRNRTGRRRDDPRRGVRRCWDVRTWCGNAHAGSLAGGPAKGGRSIGMECMHTPTSRLRWACLVADGSLSRACCPTSLLVSQLDDASNSFSSRSHLHRSACEFIAGWFRMSLGCLAIRRLFLAVGFDDRLLRQHALSPWYESD